MVPSQFWGHTRGSSFDLNLSSYEQLIFFILGTSSSVFKIAMISNRHVYERGLVLVLGGHFKNPFIQDLLYYIVRILRIRYHKDYYIEAVVALC